MLQDEAEGKSEHTLMTVIVMMTVIAMMTVIVMMMTVIVMIVLIYNNIISTLPQGEVWLRYVTSDEEKKKILHGCHVHPTAGHMGRERTLHRIKERFMWRGMYRDVQELVSVSGLQPT